MAPNYLLIVTVVLSVAAAFLFSWMRRDKGIVPSDDLPDALGDALDGRPVS